MFYKAAPNASSKKQQRSRSTIALFFTSRKSNKLSIKIHCPAKIACIWMAHDKNKPIEFYGF